MAKVRPDCHGAEQTDTWHETLAGAQHQAEYEFDVTPGDWTVVCDGA
jgi:hypothetical protein